MIIEIAGLTPAEAVAKMESITKEPLPESALGALEQLCVDGVIRRGVKVEHLTKEEIQAKPLKERIQMISAEMDKYPGDTDRFMKLCQDYMGDEPAYNGVIGDSHDCPACNYRRACEDFIDVSTDMESDVSMVESEAAVVAGYAKTGREVPESAKEPASRERMVKAFGERQSPTNRQVVEEILAEMGALLGDEQPKPATH